MEMKVVYVIVTPVFGAHKFNAHSRDFDAYPTTEEIGAELNRLKEKDHDVQYSRVEKHYSLT